MKALPSNDCPQIPGNCRTDIRFVPSTQVMQCCLAAITPLPLYLHDRSDLICLLNMMSTASSDPGMTLKKEISYSVIMQ